LALPFAVALVVGLGPLAFAASTYTSPYTYEQTFSSSLRLVRVDMGLKVTEKDQENGFILFEYTSVESGKKVSTGSIELVKGKTGVVVQVQLPAMPSYHETAMLDALKKKLSTEHGEPPKKAPDPPPVAPDAGPDAS
jgi:hypothetical protein